MWIDAAMLVRNTFVGLIGIDRGCVSAFDPVAETADEVLLGTDDRHLDFRASILIADGSMTVSTVARVNNRGGRPYLGIARLVHPVVVRAMLRRALVDLSRRAPSAGRRERERISMT